MPTVQCFYREQLPHLFTAGPRTIANGGNYPDSHAITYSFAGLGKMPAKLGARPVSKTFSDAAAVLIFRTPGVTPHGFGWVQIDCDTFGAHSRQVVSAVLGYEPHSRERSNTTCGIR